MRLYFVEKYSRSEIRLSFDADLTSMFNSNIKKLKKMRKKRYPQTNKRENAQESLLRNIF